MKDIKVIVFDFDDTIYSGVDWSKEWSEYCKSGMREMFKELNGEEFERLVKKEDVGTFTSNSIVKIMKKYNKNIDLWLKYREEHDCDVDYSNCKCISNDILRKIAQKYTLYLCSNSIPKEIQKTINHFSIDLSMFKKIYTNDYRHGADKKWYYQKIIQDENIAPSNLLAIGDSEIIDIKPAQEIGAQSLLIKNCELNLKDLL